MKTTFAFLALAASALAQIPGLPSCAQDCVQLPKDCQTTDFKCICGNKDFITTISCCVSKSCSTSEQATVIKFAQSLCGGYGVQLPSAAGCSDSAASATAASSGSASGSSSAAGGSSSGSSNGASTVTTTQSGSMSVTTTTTTASAARSTGGAIINMVPEAGVLLGGVMAGMVML